MLKVYLFLLTLFFHQLCLAGQWHEGVNAGVFGIRKYYVYTPKNFSNKKSYSLIVMIHGCEQNAKEFVLGSRMHEFADNEQFVILAPEQNKDYNPYRCWNWILPQNNARTGESDVIRMMTDDVIRDFNIDESKIFAVGMSSGAAMVNILGNCYPEKFKALASHDGIMYNASNIAIDYEEVVVNGPSIAPWISAFKGFLCSGIISKPRSKPIIIFHGVNGAIMSPVHAFQIENQYKVFNDYLDNGKRDFSFFKEKTVDYIKDGKTYGMTVNKVTNKFNETFIERYMVNHLGHEWSGGDKAYPYNDPAGPNASELIIQFFKRFGLNSKNSKKE